MTLRQKLVGIDHSDVDDRPIFAKATSNNTNRPTTFIIRLLT